MAETEHELVTCPSCGKAYRWKATAVGKVVPCRKCGAEFIVPKHPGKGRPLEPEPDNESSVYALAMDLQDEPAAPPPPKRPEPAPSNYQPPEPAVDTSLPGDAGAADAGDTPEEPAEVSEAVKAQRREEQRKAAAEITPSAWSQYKVPILVAGGIGLVVVVLLVLLFVSDALDGFLG